MSHHNIGLYHLQKNIENKKAKKFFNRIIYFIIALGILVNLPQLFKIFYEKTAAGVSLISWLGYSFISIAWLIYGISNKEKPIIINSIFLFIIQAIIVTGIILYS